MKIVLISLLGRGGMIHYSSQFANSLAEKNEVMVILPHHAELSYFNKKINFLLISAPPSIVRTIILSFNFLAFYKLFSEVKKYRPDVIHLVNTHPWNLFFIFFFREIPIIFTYHDPITHEQSLMKKVFQPILSISDFIVLKFSKTIIVHGNTLKKLCIQNGIPDIKVIVIPHGDYLFFTNYIKDKSVKNDSKQKNVLFFGRIEEYKGIEFFIASAVKVNQIIPNVTFTIAGEGNFKPYYSMIENIEIFQIINRYISDSEVAHLFYRADIVVLPYISATQSGVVPIAYAFKKPVIATDVGALSEVIENGKTGFIVPPKDIDSLVEKIVILLKNDELRQNMGDNALKKMKSELSWEKIADDVSNIYSNLAVNIN